MRRAPHEGQNPRRLQLNATSLSWPQSAQRSRRKPCARMPHSGKGIELGLGRSAAGRHLRRPPRRRRRSRRAAGPAGTAWSARGGGVRSGPGRHPAPGGAADRWLARVAHVETVVLYKYQAAQRAAMALCGAYLSCPLHGDHSATVHSAQQAASRRGRPATRRRPGQTPESRWSRPAGGGRYEFGLTRTTPLPGHCDPVRHR